jgi:hypothetical protein
VETVKAYTAHERSVLVEVTELRGAARTVSQDDVAARAKAEGALSAASARVFARAMAAAVPVSSNSGFSGDGGSGWRRRWRLVARRGDSGRLPC